MRSWFRLISAVLTLFFLSASSVAGAEKTKIIVGSDWDYPPYEFFENNKPKGFNIELMQAVAGVMGMEAEFRFGPWSKVRQDLEQGKTDAISGIIYSETRAKIFAFTLPHSESLAVLFVRQDSPVHLFEEIRNKEIIVQKDDIMHDYLRKSGLTSRIVPVPDHPEALRLLASGKHDGALLPAHMHALYVMDKFALTNLRVLKTPIPAQQRCFAVARDNRALLYKLDEGLNIVKATGKYRAIYEKWFGIYEKDVWWKTIKYFVAALAAIGLLLLLSLVWSRSLKREVRIRTAEIKETKETLRENEEQLRALINGMPDFVVFKDNKGRWLQANDAAIALFELGGFDYRGKNNLELAAPSSHLANVLRVCEESDEKAWDLGSLYRLEEIVPQPDGGARIYDVIKMPLFHADGSRKGLVVLGRNITERRQMEDELRRARAELERRVEERTVELAQTNDRLKSEIIERKKIEAALRESEEKHRAIVEAFDGQIYICSRDYRMEFMNKRLIERTGRDATGEPCYTVLHNRDSICPWCVNDRVQRGETVRWELQSPKDNHWYYVVNTPIYHADGTISKQAMILDITERKQMEEALRESEEKYRTLVDNVTIGVYRNTGGPRGRFVQANPAMVKIFGYGSLEEFLEVAVADLYQNPENRKPFAEEVKRYGFVKDKELALRKKDGTPIWCSCTATAQYDEHGDIKWMDGVIEDITERKQTEQALRENEEKYRTLVDNINMAVFRVAPTHPGRLLQINPAMSALSGYTQKELMELSVIDVYYDPRDREPLLNELKLKGFVKDKELRLRKKDGTPVWASLTMSVQHDAQGNIQWIDAVGEDITERKRSEELLAQKTAELERSNRELEHFASIASHDLRAPLSTIGGFAQLIDDQYRDKLNEKARQALDAIITGTQTMDALISDLLAYARVTSGAQSFGPVSCKAVVERTLTNLKADIEKHGAVITCGDLPIVYGDETQFAQLFQNLIGNAIKYHGKHPPRIHISAKPLLKSGGGSDSKIGWLFSVADNGIGIDQEHREKIFEIFKRLHHGDKYSGTGIGLAICKKIVERHNGRIWVTSEPGKGSTFCFTIPDHSA